MSDSSKQLLKIMRNNSISRRILAVLAAGIVCFPTVQAQNGSAYFLDGSFDRYRMNPALTPERSYLYIAGLGGFGVNAGTNVGLANFIYKSVSHPGDLTTFMSNDVDADNFLNALPSVSNVNLNMDVNLLGFGFGKSNWYGWFDCSLKSRTGLSIPKDLFTFMKSGFKNESYAISDINLTSMNYVQSSFGFQFEPVNRLRLGVQANVLNGVAYAKAAIDRMDINLGTDKWLLGADGSVQMYVPTTRLTLDDGHIDGIETGCEGVKTQLNFGMSVNLGAEYDMSGVIPGLILSASVTDLGSITWDQVQNLKTRSGKAEFEGFAQDGAFDTFTDDLSDMMSFEDNYNVEKIKTGLAPTFRAGVEYSLPFAGWASVGELVTVSSGVYDFKEYRTSLNITAGKNLDLAGSVAFSNFGTSYGGILNIHSQSTILFIAAECGSLNLNTQYIPLDRTTVAVSMGIKFAISDLRY